jgi:hypothetical protein
VGQGEDGLIRDKMAAGIPRRFGGMLIAACCCCGPGFAAEWTKPGEGNGSPVWGLKDGLHFAIYPGGFTEGDGGPRGLIRLGYPTLPDGGYDLINFIAIEPTVAGLKGYSELEKSALDHKDGKVLWTGKADEPSGKRLDPGIVKTISPGVEELTVTVFVEKFDNGAHVRLTLAQRSDMPDELALTVEAEADSAPIESCVLTATMGNKARTRILFLKDGPVSSLQLYPEHRGDQFGPHTIYPLERLPRNAAGDVIAVVANDEPDPAVAQAGGRPSFWDYKGVKVAQYWRKPSAGVQPDLACAVNGRFTYWMSKDPIPGGIAFENFELREPFKSGQSFVFGITRKGPAGILRGSN